MQRKKKAERFSFSARMVKWVLELSFGRRKWLEEAAFVGSEEN